MPGGGGRPMGGFGARYGGGSYAPRAYIPRVAPRPLPAVKSSYTRPVYGPAAVRARPIPRPPVWKTRPSALGRTLIRGPQKTVRLITNRQLPRQIAARGRQAGRAAVQKALPRIRAAIPTRILDRGRRLIPVARSGAARAQRVVSRLPALPRVRVPGRTPVTATSVRQAVRRAVPARSAPRPRPATQPATPIRAAQTVRRPLTLPRPPKPPVRKQPVLPPRQPYAKTAQRMIAEATKTERTVTPRLRGMASAAGGRLWEEGLKYKLKSAESLTRKLKGGETEPADVLRYTVIFPHEQLAAGAQKMLRSLPRGYQVMRVRNGWTTLKEGTNEPDVGAYRGINTVIQTKKGRRFELQFHTPESLAVKEAGTHDLYETVRNRRLPLKMRDEAKLAAGLYSETLLLPPPGVNRIKSFSRLDSKGAYIFEKRPRAEYDAIYEQDHMGRAVRATMHDARIVPPDSRARNLAAQAKVKREGDKDDHAGHLVANLFGGSGQRYNLAPMAGSALNLGSYRRLENELKRAAQSGRKVDLDVHAFYPDDQSRRPSGFRVTAAIDGKSFTTDFVNHAKTPEE